MKEKQTIWGDFLQFKIFCGISIFHHVTNIHTRADVMPLSKFMLLTSKL